MSGLRAVGRVAETVQVPRCTGSKLDERLRGQVVGNDDGATVRWKNGLAADPSPRIGTPAELGPGVPSPSGSLVTCTAVKFPLPRAVKLFYSFFEDSIFRTITVQ